KGVPRGIDVRDRVMHDLPVARYELHTGDVARLGEDVVHDETAVDIARLTGNRVRLRREGEIRRPQWRRVSEDARGRQIVGVPLWRPGFHPALDRRDLGGRQAAHAVELAVARDWLPGRHPSARDHLADLLA